MQLKKRNSNLVWERGAAQVFVKYFLLFSSHVDEGKAHESSSSKVAVDTLPFFKAHAPRFSLSWSLKFLFKCQCFLHPQLQYFRQSMYCHYRYEAPGKSVLRASARRASMMRTFSGIPIIAQCCVYIFSFRLGTSLIMFKSGEISLFGNAALSFQLDPKTITAVGVYCNAGFLHTCLLEDASSSLGHILSRDSFCSCLI